MNGYQREMAKHFKTFESLEAKHSEILNWAVGLAGETGEVMEMIKHHVWGKEELDKMELAKELGDVLWYLSAICTTFDMDIDDVAHLNASKLAHRHGKAYSVEGSQKRHQKEIDFKETALYKSIAARILKQKAPLNIVIVGPDGSGKTTLAKKLAEALPEMTYQKCNYEQKDKPELALDIIMNKTNMILDRFYYPDDLIYSKIVAQRDGNDPEWDNDYWQKYNDVFKALEESNTIFLFVTASLDKLKERAAEWKDDYVAVEELEAINDLYARWRASTGSLFHYCLDTSTIDVDTTLKHALECISEAQKIFSNEGVTRGESQAAE